MTKKDRGRLRVWGFGFSQCILCSGHSSANVKAWSLFWPRPLHVSWVQSGSGHFWTFPSLIIFSETTRKLAWNGWKNNGQRENSYWLDSVVCLLFSGLSTSPAQTLTDLERQSLEMGYSFSKAPNNMTNLKFIVFSPSSLCFSIFLLFLIFRLFLFCSTAFDHNIIPHHYLL